jgi:hypothetical protein
MHGRPLQGQTGSCTQQLWVVSLLWLMYTMLCCRSVVPVRRGYWGNKIGKPHTVPTKTTGKCGSVTVRHLTLTISLPLLGATSELSLLSPAVYSATLMTSFEDACHLRLSRQVFQLKRSP